MTKQTQQDTSTGRMKFWRRSNLARGDAVLGVLAGVATGTWAVEETAKLASIGLRGIFPNTAPPELSAEEFARLDGNWAEWSKQTAEIVSQFYAKLETADAAGQREALGVLKSKLDVMQRAIDDPRYKSLLAPLVLMRSRLSQRVDFAEGALDTLELDPQKVRGIKLTENGKLGTTTINELKGYLTGIPNGLLWIPYVKADALQKGLTADPASEATITMVREAKDRVRAALNHARFEFPARRITVNLAPADLPKDSGRFDLPIALGILAAVAEHQRIAVAVKVLLHEASDLAEPRVRDIRDHQRDRVGSPRAQRASDEIWPILESGQQDNETDSGAQHMMDQ